MNQSTHKKPHANRTEKRLLWVKKFIILSHSVVPLIHTLSHTHFEYIFIRCCYSMGYSSVCYTAHLYGHKLLKCCIPFSLNKHKEIRQTHSQWDASMLRVITTITIIIITKIEKKQREKQGDLKTRSYISSDAKCVPVSRKKRSLMEKRWNRWISYFHLLVKCLYWCMYSLSDVITTPKKRWRENSKSNGTDKKWANSKSLALSPLISFSIFHFLPGVYSLVNRIECVWVFLVYLICTECSKGN